MRQKTKTWVLETEGKHPRAFTLIEMLVVISILTLLVTILVPSLSAAKMHARVAKTKTLLHALNTGLEMFHQDKNVGGDYPPSTWDTTTAGDPNDTDDGSYIAYGAETILWAMMGADELGTPGFQTPLHAGPGGFYEVNATGPLHQRSGPFFTPSQTAVDTIEITTSGNEHAAKVLIDPFHFPVLYYKADTSKTRSDPNAIYIRDHNLGFIEGDPLEVDKSSSDGALSFDDAFQRYVWNPRIEAVYRPHNSESFLLICAGPDGIYGTRDDITNFPVVGRNFLP